MQLRLSLSADGATQPWPVLRAYFLKNGNLILKIIYEYNNIFTADVQLCSTEFSFGDHVGADWGDDPLALP